MNTSYETLCRDLRAMGIAAGDVLMVHSSLSSMGHVEGGAATVIHALYDVLTPAGTLLLPAFSYRTAIPSASFSQNDTPSCVGTIPETFRQMPGVLRSFHPTHSVCALGARAAELVGDHGLDDTPMGEHSPFRKLPACKGKILMLGCGLRSNSFMHGMEELAGVSYVLGDALLFRMTDKDGVVTDKPVRLHHFDRPGGHLIQRYDRVPDVLSEADGDYVRGVIHGADSILYHTVSLEAKTVAKLHEDETYFIDDPNGVL